MAITSVEEAILHLGKENVVTPEQLNGILNFPQKFDPKTPLNIPKKLLNWKGSTTREVRRKLLDTGSMVSNTIRNYNVKEIYYVPNKKRHPNSPTFGYRMLNFPEPVKWWQFWRWGKEISTEAKINWWSDFRRGNGEAVWIVYDEPVKNRCPFVLIPGISVDVLDVAMKYDYLIDDLNDPLHWLYKQEPEAGNRKVEHRWYLVYKYPDRSRFANKNRTQQISLLKRYEQWGYLCEALYATVVYRRIYNKNILTDYTLTKDLVCLTDGKRTAMIRNFVDCENNPYRGQIQVSQDPWFHGHRNTVPFVVIKV